MSAELIVILGHENHQDETLKSVAESRLNRAIKYLDERSSVDNVQIVATGGFDSYFNTSNKAHGEIINEYLLSRNVDSDSILPFVKVKNLLKSYLGLGWGLNALFNIFDFRA